MKYIKEQNEFVLENKITDFFKKFNISKIKEDLKEKLDIEESDSKKEIFIKLTKNLHDKSFEFIANHLSTIVGGALGALLGDLISYILTIFADINTVEQLLLMLAGMIFMLYRSKTGIDKYGLGLRSFTKDEPIKSPDYDELSDKDEISGVHFISKFGKE